MVKTGKSFDMNPETFTLDNLFAMELHNFKDVIGNIVTSAAKELSIEKVMRWTFINIKYVLKMYTKNSIVRMHTKALDPV